MLRSLRSTFTSSTPFISGRLRRCYGTESVPDRKVAVLGAAGGIGQPLALLRKLNPLVSKLALHDIAGTPGVAADFRHIHTRSEASDKVIIPAGVPRKPGMTRDDLFNINAGMGQSRKYRPALRQSQERRALRQLTLGSGKSAGRNSSGRITIFHRGGGSKRLQRRIDLKRSTSSMGIVERIEYDPNRSSRIALVRWMKGVRDAPPDSAPKEGDNFPGPFTRPKAKRRHEGRKGRAYSYSSFHQLRWF